MHKVIMSVLLTTLISFAPFTLATVRVENPQVRATFDGAMSSAAYMTLVNDGKRPVTLVQASVSPDVVGEVQIHTTVMQDDMMKMVHLKQGIAIPAGETLALQPGGYHIMLMGLKQGLKEGDSLGITLHFDQQEAVTVEAAVKRIDKSSHHHHH